jgi:type II secretory pathway component PulC
MRYLYLILFIGVLSGCSEGVELRPISLALLFNDSNSKIWIINEVNSGNKNFAPKINVEKDVVIFYESGKCILQPMNTIGDLEGKRGEYSLYPDENLISLFFAQEKWEFNINVQSENKIILSPTSNSDIKYQLVLIPFPEI